MPAELKRARTVIAIFEANASWPKQGEDIEAPKFASV